MTKQRLLIYQILKNSESHLTADEVFVIAKKQMPSIVRATVYNNLNLLTEKNIIRRIKLQGQPAHYDKNIGPHDHVICDQCGEIADIKINDMLAYLRKNTGMEVTSYELILHYICDKCHAKNMKLLNNNNSK
jgi:Fe2+ or Zn2+ uptake regulation protein